MKPVITVVMMLAMLLPVFPQEPQPPTEADIVELRQKAEAGDAEAQFQLGRKYSNGDGVPKDDKEAVRWYRLAAEQGDVDAQFNLALKYSDGEGVPQDDEQAVRWYSTQLMLDTATGRVWRLVRPEGEFPHWVEVVPPPRRPREAED